MVYSQLPSRGTRIFSVILDNLFFLAVIIAGAFLDDLFGFAENDDKPIAMTFFLLFTITQLIFISKDGQSFGKKVCKVKIVKSTDYTNGGFLHNVFLRGLINIASITVIIPLANIITMLSRSDKRALHDLIAGTVVVHQDSTRSDIIATEDSTQYAVQGGSGSLPKVVVVVAILFAIIFFGGISWIASGSNEWSQTELLSHNGEYFSIQYPSLFSVNEEDSIENYDNLVLNNLSAAYSVEASLTLDNTTPIESYAHNNLVLDSVITTSPLTEYGNYKAEGIHLEGIMDDVKMITNVYYLEEGGVRTMIVESYSDFLQLSSEKHLKEIAQSFKIILPTTIPEAIEKNGNTTSDTNSVQEADKPTVEDSATIS